ncbi:nucleoside-diphosphate sugar epimerase/dehydratase [Alisedimentitalea sp. MJ-SS2]|uniref:polysaccharide biosynthesis protein n=1 Tax=Aliisedimentitalea sp. MJ-SS2 TaxID=3049795 RepID=UPI00290CF707|nr:nucleoside-diphosphate sugar epimerase/dehydratase [Alisedimentitalea sp. MJ-SS2]MDU8927725.1 nucleoside-diphosphate sugar epimerase/dehydratase [Alisedimentitalea sp. MJ-SS2]
MTIYEFVMSLTRNQKRNTFLVIDGLMVPVALSLSIFLNAADNLTWDLAGRLAPLVAILIGVAVASSHLLGLTRIKLNAYEFQGIIRTAILAGIVGVSGLCLNYVFSYPATGNTFLIFTMALLIMSVSVRMFMRQTLIRIYRTGLDRMRVLVYGAGQTGQQLAAALRTDDTVRPVAFVDDNPTLQSLVVSGLPVFAPSKIKELIENEEIDRVVLAMPSSSQTVQARIAHKLRQMGTEVHSLPSFATLVGEGDLGQQSSPVSLSDLLGRSRLEHELPTVSDTYSGHRILITGAGGSIGSELCRQLISCKPESLVLFDHSELALYTIVKELQELTSGIEIVPVLGSVCDRGLVDQALTENHVNVVLHAAAYKHLPLVEINEIAGLDNNVFGTKTMADAARANEVERFILVSSDKAVRPTNVMGASKRLAELVVQDLSTRSTTTRFSMVRFGNVLGSSGSVIPLFEEQIARGGPVTLTHGEVTRYFMTISEAARLVLLAGSFARGGDLFVLDMGDPVPIRKLARQMIEGAGLTVTDEENPEGDIEIVEIGLRPGEKLHEELLISPDMLTTPHQKIMRAQENFLSEIEMANALKDLRSAISTRDPKAARAVISHWVERFEDSQKVEQQIS